MDNFSPMFRGEYLAMRDALQEEIAALRAELAARDAEIEELRRWKSDVMSVFAKLDLQEIGKVLGVVVGGDISSCVLPGILARDAEIARLRVLVGEAFEEAAYCYSECPDNVEAYWLDSDAHAALDNKGGSAT
jgi:hypothetical protein